MTVASKIISNLPKESVWINQAKHFQIKTQRYYKGNAYYQFEDLSMLAIFSDNIGKLSYMELDEPCDSIGSVDVYPYTSLEAL